MRVAHCTLLSLLFASAKAYSSYDFNLTPGVTPLSHDIYNLHMTIFWVCVGIGIVVFGVMIYAIIHHRKSKGVKPAHFHEHLWLEITWTIIPFIILIFMAVPATRVLIHLRNTDKSDLTIKVTGYQWKWQYEYIENGIKFFSNNATPLDQIHNKIPKDLHYLRQVDKPLILPIHKKIRFLFTANDVLHAWWVPDLGIKQDAIPGYITEAWARINRPGTYFGQCAELCGVNHAYMPIVVIAMSQIDFDKWVQTQQGTAIPSTKPEPSQIEATSTPEKKDEDIPKGNIEKPTAQPTQVETKPASAPTATKEQQMELGEKTYNTVCAVCHQANGEGMPPVYPALKGSEYTTGPLPKHMDRVLFGKTGTAMQAFKDQLTDEELAAVITYERNAWGNKGEVIQVSEIKAAKEKGPLP